MLVRWMLLLSQPCSRRAASQSAVSGEVFSVYFGKRSFAAEKDVEFLCDGHLEVMTGEVLHAYDSGAIPERVKYSHKNIAREVEAQLKVSLYSLCLSSSSYPNQSNTSTSVSSTANLWSPKTSRGSIIRWWAGTKERRLGGASSPTYREEAQTVCHCQESAGSWQLNGRKAAAGV